jgi:hypothetical protein
MTLGKPVGRIYTDRLGRQRVILELPQVIEPLPKVERLHSHGFFLDAKESIIQHLHAVDPLNPEHIHPPEEPDAA